MDMLKSRRRFLMQLAATGALLPLSRVGLAKMALLGESQQAKLKVVFFIVPDGLAVDSFNGPEHNGNGLWFPTAAGNASRGLDLSNRDFTLDTSDFTLNAVSQELAAYREQSLYLRGFILGPGNGGHNGWNYALRDNQGSKPSIDILLGDAIPGTQPTHRSLFAGPHAGTDGTPWYVSWSAQGMRAPHQNPVRMYEAVFGAVSQDARDSQARGAHVFDPVLADIQEVQSRLSGSQLQKLKDHLDAVEQVKADMDGAIPSVCEPLSIEDHPISSAAFRNQVQASHHQVVATALSCGVTRVATIQVGRSAESLNILDVSATTNPHDCAHRFGGEDVWRGSRQWYVRQAKLFMDELAKRADPDVPGDNLLKHTLVVLTSEMADGAPEHTRNMPLVLMGGASGLLKSGNGNGRFFDVRTQGDHSDWLGNYVSMQRVWASIASAAGATVPYGGNVSPINGIFTTVGS
ncbi:DUF1552 domain-containing protein [Pseudomonas defluvii]|uniref:DUF1552 domain-containing protein n=1 Tax=Pseudomonas defluvii TaxID=1876757 RepID=UPI003905A6A0